MALKFRHLSVPQAKQALRHRVVNSTDLTSSQSSHERRQTYETDNDITRAGQIATAKEDRSVTGAADRWTLRRDSLRPVHAGATRSLSLIDRCGRARAGRRAPKRSAEDLDQQPKAFKSGGFADLASALSAQFSESA